MHNNHNETERRTLNPAAGFRGYFNRTTPQCVLKHLLTLLALIATPVAVDGVERLPNFVIIFSDDQGYEDVGCFGSKQISTPRLDQMAAEGMKFTSFYAQPICGPSRAALMTGCHPLRVAERGNVKNIHPFCTAKKLPSQRF